jgi:hypothetical protein
MDPGILEINFKTHYLDPLHNKCRYKFRSMLVNSWILLVVLVASGTTTRNVYTYPQREILIGVTITVVALQRLFGIKRGLYCRLACAGTWKR